MAAWAGFSENELRKVKKLSQQGNVRPKTNRSNCTDPASPEDERQHVRSFTNNTRATAKIAKQRTSTETVTSSENGKKSSQKPAEIVIKAEPMDTSTSHIKTEAVDESEKIQDLDDSQALKHNLKSMSKFQEQQKQIEEANKQKKALLAKTLTERKKAAQKEAHKLEHIQKELAKLDTLLTADVQVIRGKIEDASRDFMEAHKRFERAEVEYVAAKMDLHNKQEMKEQLTEHLYTIIHQNEVRKAKKLADLMKTLEMEAEGDEELSLPELPPLTSFQPSNNISHTGSKHIAHEHHTHKHHTHEHHSDTNKTSDNANKAGNTDKSSNESQTNDKTKGVKGKGDAAIMDGKVCDKPSEPNAQEDKCGKADTNDTESCAIGDSEKESEKDSIVKSGGKDSVKHGELTTGDAKSTKTDKISETSTSDGRNETKNTTNSEGTSKPSGTKSDAQSKVSDSNSPQNAIDLSIVKTEREEEVGVKESPVRNAWSFDASLK